MYCLCCWVGHNRARICIVRTLSSWNVCFEWNQSMLSVSSRLLSRRSGKDCVQPLPVGFVFRCPWCSQLHCMCTRDLHEFTKCIELSTVPSRPISKLSKCNSMSRVSTWFLCGSCWVVGLSRLSSWYISKRYWAKCMCTMHCRSIFEKHQHASVLHLSTWNLR